MTPPSADATKKLLAALWQKNLPVVRVRLDQLDAVTAAMAATPLSPEALRDASSTAHKLAGSLGMFGYPKGTALARELELLFDDPTPDPATAVTLAHQLRTELGL